MGSYKGKSLCDPKVISKMDGVLKSIGLILQQAEALGHDVENLKVPEEKIEAYWSHLSSMETEEKSLKDIRRRLPNLSLPEAELTKKIANAAKVPFNGNHFWSACPRCSEH